ncbi:stalk domain-containing protein [Brevibacillus thermoruber]
MTIIENGTTYVPARVLVSTFGLTNEWDG